MGLKGIIRVIFFYLIVLVFLPVQQVLASWLGPAEVVSGEWGYRQGQFYYKKGNPTDGFPRNFGVDGNGNILITDEGNKRVQVFSPNGSLRKIISHPPDLIVRRGWPFNIYVHPLGNFVAAYSKGQKFFYDSRGNLIKKANVYGRAIPCEEGYYFEVTRAEYHLYSISGKFLKIHNGKLPELGTETTERIGGQKYKITIKYPDKNYKIIAFKEGGENVRDLYKNLYRILKFIEKDNEQSFVAYSVYRCDACDGVISLFNVPKSQYEPEPPEAINYPTWKPKVIVEYGEPIVSPSGDICCWARTKTHYKILKWTWEGDPDAPQRLTVAPSKTALSLTWNIPLQNPQSVTGYEIARSTNLCGPYTAIGTVPKNVLKYKDTKVTTGETHYYKVRAVVGKDYSGYSKEAVGAVK